MIVILAGDPCLLADCQLQCRKQQTPRVWRWTLIWIGESRWNVQLFKMFGSPRYSRRHIGPAHTLGVLPGPVLGDRDGPVDVRDGSVSRGPFSGLAPARLQSGVEGGVRAADVMGEVYDERDEREELSNYNQENCPLEGDGIV